MTANVYLTQYESFGGRKLGGEDDLGGALPQFPGKIVGKPIKIAVTTGTSVELDSRTTFIKLQTYDADCLFTFQGGAFASGAHGDIADTNNDRMTPGQIIFQGLVGSRTKAQFFKQVNLKEIS